MGIARFCFLLLILISASNSFGQTPLLEEITKIDFGTVAIVNNDSPRRIILDRAGNYQVGTGIYILRRGQAGVYRISGFAGNVRLFITVTASQGSTTTEDFSPEQFTIISYDHSESVTTNGLGVTEFLVGGIIETSGSGTTNFRDTTYTTQLRVSIDF
jgi:hypothetical protein